MSFFIELKRRNVLRVALFYLAGSWLLIQVLETLFPIFRLDETSIQIVVIILAIGFIPALILSWVFELTPEGIKRDKDVDRSAPATIASGKGLDRMIIVVLVLALGYFAVDKFVIDPARDAEIIETATERARTEALFESFGDKSIVVLPFVNMSADPDQEYFSDGISEELLNLLSKIQELRVISRTSAFSFKGKDVDIPTIAERLNVDHVLEGSVRTAGNRVRITAQLIDARTDTHLWSETYDRELDDIFAIQDEISAQVVEQLKITLLGELPQAEQIDTEAYGLYLRARHIVHGGQYEKLELAEELLNRALEIEPNYLRAWGELARVYLSDENRADEEVEQLVRSIAAKTHELYPDSADDLIWRGWLLHHYDRNLVGAAPLFERALALEPPDLDFLRLIARFLGDIGKHEQAIAVAEYLTLRDPNCVVCLTRFSALLRATGQYDRAVEKLQEAIAWSPDRHGIYWGLGSALLLAGRPAEALTAFDEEKMGDIGQFGSTMALHDLGRIDEFEERFARMRADPDQHPEGIARIAAWTGDFDLALEMLEKTVEQEGPGILAMILHAGFYEKLKKDPRFDEFLRKHGQHPDQREKIPFNFTLPGVEKP